MKSESYFHSLHHKGRAILHKVSRFCFDTVAVNEQDEPRLTHMEQLDMSHSGA